MPSLFERLGRSLARKKTEEHLSKPLEKTPSAANEPNGKHEPVSTTDARPAPTEFPSIQEKSRLRQKRFSRAKSPSARPVPTTRVPVLSLHLPELKDAAAAKAHRLTFEAITEDPELMPDALAKRRLTPPEASYLAKQTSGALHGKGLATLGIFKPHWHSASQDEQHRLVTLFLQSIANSTTLPPPPGTSLEKFEAHLQKASPHDVADLLKWGLRHLQLENQSFPIATSADEWAWYKSFAEAERAADFPANAYTELLLPLLPPAHQELLSTFLDIGTSVTAHAETNGVSGSKLTRLVGWWLLSQRNPASNGLVGFIQEWETAARILEHIYLAYIRDHARAGNMPKRLTQLVKSYPYLKQASPMDHHFLPRPKFTTRRQTALFVRVNTVSREQQTTYRNNPIQLLNDALHAHIDKQNSPSELLAVWEALRAHAYANHQEDTAAEEGNPAPATLTLSALLTEEAIRLLTSPRDDDGAHSPPVAQSQTSLPLRQSSTGGPASRNSRAPSDWDGFTSAGFGFMDAPNLAGALQDYTAPPTSPGKTKREFGRRSSLDSKGPGAATEYTSAGKPPIVSETVAATLLLDEALIDGWADTLCDPAVSTAWPTFVLYHLKAPLADPTAAADASETREHDPAPGIGWIVIETAAPASPPATRDAASAANGKERHKERRSSSRPRFGGLFSSSTSIVTAKDKDKDKESKKKDKETGDATGRWSIGILKEATRSQRSLANQPIVEEAVPPVPKKSHDAAVVPSTAVTAAAVIATAGVIATVAEEAEEAAGGEPTFEDFEPVAAPTEETHVPAGVDAAQVDAVEESTEPVALAEQATSAPDEDAAQAESEATEAEAARIEAELAAKALEEERLAAEAEKAMEEERIEREVAAEAEEEEAALQQRMEAERVAEEARLRELEEQRLAELAAREEEERLAREAEELAAKEEEERLAREAEEERLRVEAEETERQAQLQREEEARQAEAARVEQERREAEAAAEKARLEEELERERERVRKEEEEREAARIAEEKQREEEEAAAAALLVSQQAAAQQPEQNNEEGTEAVEPLDQPADAEPEDA